MNDEPNPYDVAGMRKYVAEHKGERRGTSQPIEFEIQESGKPNKAEQLGAGTSQPEALRRLDAPVATPTDEIHQVMLYAGVDKVGAPSPTAPNVRDWLLTRLRNGGDLITYADLEPEDWERLMDEYASSLVAATTKRLDTAADLLCKIALLLGAKSGENPYQTAQRFVAAKEEEIAELKRRLSAHENV
jgi:hypothetical protein